MDIDYLYQDILTNHANIKNLEGDITSGLSQLELRLSALSVELGALKDRLTELETVEISTLMVRSTSFFLIYSYKLSKALNKQLSIIEIFTQGRS